MDLKLINIINKILLPYCENPKNKGILIPINNYENIILNRSDHGHYILTLNNIIIATISNFGELLIRKDEYLIIKEKLEFLIKNPILFFSTFGKKINKCLICHSKLNDFQSKNNGIDFNCKNKIN